MNVVLMEFVDALIQENLEAIRRCPKSDLHNHFVLGGSRHFLREYSGRDILPIKHPLHSMDEMHAWNSKNIGTIFETPEGRRMLIQATFLQAKDDGVTILEIGEDVWGLGEFFNGSIGELVDAFETAHDVLIFDSDVSKEYLRLYQCGCLNADELDDIRKSGLKPV